MLTDKKTAVLEISGMRNNSCRELIAEVLWRVSGVRDVSVSLIRARAVIVYMPPCDPAALIRAVLKAGYGTTLAANELE